MVAARIATRRVWITLGVLGMVLGLAACEKLPESVVPTSIEAIPAGYGELVGVTPHGAHPYITVLWFEKPDKTIVGMRVDLAHDRIIAEPVASIPRN
jgi:hypothetical protein